MRRSCPQFEGLEAPMTTVGGFVMMSCSHVVFQSSSTIAPYILLLASSFPSLKTSAQARQSQQISPFRPIVTQSRHLFLLPSLPLPSFPPSFPLPAPLHPAPLLRSALPACIHCTYSMGLHFCDQ